jgi:integrase/recombinase XerD
MKPTDLSIHVTNFLTRYLAAQRNLSPNTIKAYRDVFTLLLRFGRDVRGTAVERLSLADVDVAFVEAFLDHLGKDRHCSIRTQNQRLAVLHAFFRYVQSEVPERMLQCQKIMALPLRRHIQVPVGYLSKEELTQVLAHPNLETLAGRRDVVMLSVLYDTGARVQELIDLNVNDVRLTSPAQIYARANLEMKRRALEKVAGESPSASLPPWQKSNSLLDWLLSL